MVKRYIPEKYDISETDLAELIYTAIGRTFPLTITGRMIKTEEALTAPELQAIKTAFLAEVEEVSEL